MQAGRTGWVFVDRRHGGQVFPYPANHLCALDRDSATVNLTPLDSRREAFTQWDHYSPKR
jgi:hypothetical protein